MIGRMSIYVFGCILALAGVFLIFCQYGTHSLEGRIAFMLFGTAFMMLGLAIAFTRE